jgi:DNA-binding MarR family transcriptional regulator
MIMRQGAIWTMKNDEAALLLQGVLALGRRLRAERPQGSQSLAVISLLSTLKRRGPLSSARLAAEERLQPQSITRLISSLEQKGWISRDSDQQDRRHVVISLTDDGRGILAVEMRARREWLRRALDATLNEQERAVVSEASQAMLKLAFYEETPGP